MKCIRWLFWLLLFLEIGSSSFLFSQSTFAISGTIVTARGVLDNGTMIVVDGRIQDIKANFSPPKEMTWIKVDGVILPGLIDLHNHLVWNVFPRWLPGREFRNRYEWQDTAEYDRKLKSPQARMMERKLGCDAEIYAEVKALVGGATSVTGSFKDVTC